MEESDAPDALSENDQLQFVIVPEGIDVKSEKQVISPGQTTVDEKSATGKGDTLNGEVIVSLHPLSEVRISETLYGLNVEKT